jgi:hypothetical protein
MKKKVVKRDMAPGCCGLETRAMAGPPFGSTLPSMGPQKGGCLWGARPARPCHMPTIGLALLLSPLEVDPPYLTKFFFSLLSLLIRSGLARSNFLGFNFFQLFLSFYKFPPSNQSYMKRPFRTPIFIRKLYKKLLTNMYLGMEVE